MPKYDWLKSNLLPKNLVKSIHLVGPVELDAVDERLDLLQLEELVLGHGFGRKATAGSRH